MFAPAFKYASLYLSIKARLIRALPTSSYSQSTTTLQDRLTELNAEVVRDATIKVSSAEIGVEPIAQFDRPAVVVEVKLLDVSRADASARIQVIVCSNCKSSLTKEVSDAACK